MNKNNVNDDRTQSTRPIKQKLELAMITSYHCTWKYISKSLERGTLVNEFFFPFTFLPVTWGSQYAQSFRFRSVLLWYLQITMFALLKLACFGLNSACVVWPRYLLRSMVSHRTNFCELTLQHHHRCPCLPLHVLSIVDRRYDQDEGRGIAHLMFCYIFSGALV